MTIYNVHRKHFNIRSKEAIKSLRTACDDLVKFPHDLNLSLAQIEINAVRGWLDLMERNLNAMRRTSQEDR